MAVNINVREEKLILGGTEYTFRLDFKAFLKLKEKYGEDYVKLLSDAFTLEGVELTINTAKLLSCCCTEKDFTLDEFLELLPADINILNYLNSLIFLFIDNSLVLKNPSEEDETEKK